MLCLSGLHRHSALIGLMIPPEKVQYPVTHHQMELVSELDFVLCCVLSDNIC